ncbi:MAG: hypothetical protein RL154_147 [Pseudomonadota bacterium]
MTKQTTFLNISFLLALCWIGYIYQAFLFDIIIAALLSLATSGTNSKISDRINKFSFKDSSNKKALAPLIASIIMTLVLMSILFVPLIYFVYKIASIVNTADLTLVLSHFKSTIMDWVKNSDYLPESAKNEIFGYTTIAKEQDIIGNSIVLIRDWGSEGMKFIFNSGLILIFYFFANLYGKQILLFTKNLMPLSHSAKQLIFDQISQTMSVVMYSTVFIAILEGVIFAIGALWLGYDPFFWGIAYAFASLIPIIGGALIWLPMAIYEVSVGNTDGALFIAAYTIVVNAIIADTFIKPVIIAFINKKFSRRGQNEHSSANSLIIFFAIIAGMSVYGFWGIILGPAVTSLFISLLKIYDKLVQSKAISCETEEMTYNV